MRSSNVVRASSFVAALVAWLWLSACASGDQRLANNGFEAIEKGQLVDAERVLTEALDLNPDNPYALLNLGTVYQRTGRFDLAREMFEMVIAHDSQEVPARKSKFLQESKTLREIAENNLKTLPAK
jgi:Tfp pilus assembly protein PilF